MKDLFICHTGADKDWARELGVRLEAQRIGTRSIEVWFDEWDVDFGENIIRRIDEGLKIARFVGLVLSPAMLGADWPAAEWMSVVMDDPTGKRGRILPLLLHRVDPATGQPIEYPFILKPLKRFDFTNHKLFEVELAKLVHRLSGQRPLRGRADRLGVGLAALAATGQDAPDPFHESLPSNLLPVVGMPELIHSDTTWVTSRPEVWSTMANKSIPPFLPYAGRLYSFYESNAPNHPFRQFLSGTSATAESVAAWVTDRDRSRQLVGMLNVALRAHCYGLAIRTTKADRTHFYCPILDGKPRAFLWGGGQRARTLAKMKTQANGAPFGVHMSARIRFIVVGARLFLLVEPAWLFTTDGVTPLGSKSAGVFSTRWGGRERNASVLRNVLMWGLLLAKGQGRVEISLGPNLVSVESVPTHTDLAVGIEGDLIRLDRILGGEGAGEVFHEYGTQSQPSVDELDEVADLALAEPGEDAHKDAIDDSSRLDDDVSMTDELELPF